VVGSVLVLGFDYTAWDAATDKAFEHALRADLGSELPAYCRIRISKGDGAGTGVIVHYRVTATSGSEAQHIVHQILISDPRTLQQHLREELERESQFVPPGLQVKTEDGPMVEELGQPTEDAGIGTATTDSAGEDAGGLPSWATAILTVAGALLTFLLLWINGKQVFTEDCGKKTSVDPPQQSVAGPGKGNGSAVAPMVENPMNQGGVTLPAPQGGDKGAAIEAHM
jgi:hypothetical protein